MKTIIKYTNRTKGQIIYCNDKGMPIIYKKERIRAPRRQGIIEKKFEKIFLDRIRKSGFDEQCCDANNWLCSLFMEKKVHTNLIISMAKFLANELKEILTREVYRRRESSIFWIQCRLQEIAILLSNNNYVIDLGEREINLTPPNIFRVPLVDADHTIDDNKFPYHQHDSLIDIDWKYDIFDQ